MRAIQIAAPGGPEVLRLVELPLPEPAPGQIRVRAQAIGVGRPDLLVRRGSYKWMPALPAIPGAELAGTVDSLGAGVDPGWLGRRELVSARELPVPQTVRVTNSDRDNRELYHWTFKPTVTVLKAGQSVPFTTRLSSPPAAARHLEVRFAKDTL